MSFPVLAPNNTWFDQAHSPVAKSEITRITIVNSYIPTNNETGSWDASNNQDGSVMCYTVGTELIIAGNGSKKIAANADSRYLFSGTSNAARFIAATEIVGAELIDTSSVTTFEHAFDQAGSLRSVDVSNWDVSNVTNMSCMFQACISLEALDLSLWNVGSVTDFSYFLLSVLSVGDMVITSLGDVSHWDVSKCTSFLGMFQRCAYIESLDLSGWDTSSAASMDTMFSAMHRLKEISLGPSFAFCGDSSGDLQPSNLPTPSSLYIAGADGYWYLVNEDRIAVSDIPSNHACTYYASINIVRDLDVLVKNSSMIDAAKSIQDAIGDGNRYAPNQFGSAIASITGNEDALISGDISSITNNRVTEIRKYGFYQSQSLATATFSAVSQIGDYAFYKCPKLSSIKADAATTLGSYAFMACPSLIAAAFPQVTAIGDGVFNECSALSDISFPLLLAIPQTAFRACEALQRADFQSVGSIGAQAFYGSGISALILRTETLCELVNVSAFMFTPIENGTGYIYIPSSLLNEYRADNTWSHYAAQFRAIEDYPDITGMEV